MTDKKTTHTFHIPVMGTSFTIDTPIKVAHLGISSVISLVDDVIIEKMREFYCSVHDIPFQAITNKIEDFRAKRITAYLNMIDKIVKEKYEQLKESILENRHELENYLSSLPDGKSLLTKFNELAKNSSVRKVQEWIQDHLNLGSIDVNIMTKLDKENYWRNEKLPNIYNDAHAALRGFANSNLASSLVLSAGMNPRLYGYMEEFEDFYPDADGVLKKQIILKVSDFRSALIQGKFLAKKGLWVSEYRIESGLNCGGHAFPTEGHLLGPILEEFKSQRSYLSTSIFEIWSKALQEKNYSCPENVPDLKVTAQGGVGTSDEHNFLLEHYKLDSIGWGTPFLLVPEATTVDSYTRELLLKAKEDDLYLSATSPLGVPFNTLRNNTKDVEKQNLIYRGRPGSSCPKRFLVSNKEYTSKAICTASKKYQDIKIKELDHAKFSRQQYKYKFNKIVEKSCLCMGLGNSALLAHGMSRKRVNGGVSICPGPNLAYFDKFVSLESMLNHIYGTEDIMGQKDRPNMFIKELKMYVDYLGKLVSECTSPIEEKQQKIMKSFKKNLADGIVYYYELFDNANTKISEMKSSLLEELKILEKELKGIPA